MVRDGEVLQILNVPFCKNISTMKLSSIEKMQDTSLLFNLQSARVLYSRLAFLCNFITEKTIA
jgi:hypothetical protein